MAMPGQTEIVGNRFKMEVLADCDMITVPENSSIKSAILTIKRYQDNPFMPDIAKKIAATRFEISRSLPPVRYITDEEWVVTYQDKVVFIKFRDKQEASINISDESAPRDGACARLSSCSIQ